jgi:DNA repair exonuclease SbcCD ATPase subunit
MADELLQDHAPEQSPVADATATPTPETAAPIETPAAPQLYEVKVDGKVMKVPLDEALRGYSRTAKFTQEMQQLARERQQWQGELQRYQEAVREVQQFLQDRKRLGEYYRRLQGDTPEPEQPSPDDPVTLQQLQAQLKQALQMRDQAWSQQVQQEIQQLKLDQLSSNYQNDFDAHISGLLTQHPELRRIPRVERLLKQEAAERGPQDPETAKALLSELAQEWAAQQSTFQTADDKRRAAGTSQLKNGIEPPGGTAPATPGQTQVYKSLADARGDVMKDLEALFRS